MLASIYGFYAFGSLTCLLLFVAYTCHSDTIGRWLGYVSISSSVAAACFMFETAVLLGPNGPSNFAREVDLALYSAKRLRGVVRRAIAPQLGKTIWREQTIWAMAR